MRLIQLAAIQYEMYDTDKVKENKVEAVNLL